MPSSDPQASAAGPSRQRLAHLSGVSACTACKRLKMRCERGSGSDRCARCEKTGKDCVVEPPKRPGRAPKSLNDAPSATLSPPPPFASTSQLPVLPPFQLQPLPATTSSPSYGHASPDGPHPAEGRLAAAANPLALFAEVADDHRHGESSTCPSPHHEAEQVVELLRGDLDPSLAELNLNLSTCKSSLLTVMAPQLFKGEKKVAVGGLHELAVRDLALDMDPIHLGLVSDAEVMLFFHTFFSSLHPMNPTLCPLLHTPAFVRRRSMFLFSVLLLLGALYTAESGAAAKRLRFHVERLVPKIIVTGYRSLEIVQAFVTYQCWQPPPVQPSEDRLWLYASLSVSMAMELRLDKPISIVRNERLSTLKDDLLDLDGGAPDDDLLARLARNRERGWLRLFLWHSAVAVSCGTPSMIVENSLLRNSAWWNHPLASQYDHITSALVELRLSFIDLSTEIKYRLQHSSPTGTAWIAPFIDSHLDPWKAKWLMPGQVQHNYLLLIHRHGRLWLLSTGLDARYGTPEERQACISDCLNSALACCKMGLDDLYTPSYLWYLTNSAFVMLVYSCSLALRLFSAHNTSMAASSHTALLGLVASLALTLERMGSTPSHRSGLASLYSRQLQRVIRGRAFALRKAHQTEDNSFLLPVDLDNLIMSSMSGFVDGNWNWLSGDGGVFVPQPESLVWGDHDGSLAFMP